MDVTNPERFIDNYVAYQANKGLSNKKSVIHYYHPTLHDNIKEYRNKYCPVNIYFVRVYSTKKKQITNNNEKEKTTDKM